jgi:hypothetical protein
MLKSFVDRAATLTAFPGKYPNCPTSAASSFTDKPSDRLSTTPGHTLSRSAGVFVVFNVSVASTADTLSPFHSRSSASWIAFSLAFLRLAALPFCFRFVQEIASSLAPEWAADSVAIVIVMDGELLRAVGGRRATTDGHRRPRGNNYLGPTPEYM